MKITLTALAKSKAIIVALVCAVTLTAQADDKKAKQQKQRASMALRSPGHA